MHVPGNFLGVRSPLPPNLNVESRCFFSPSRCGPSGVGATLIFGGGAGEEELGKRTRKHTKCCLIYSVNRLINYILSTACVGVGQPFRSWYFCATSTGHFGSRAASDHTAAIERARGELVEQRPCIKKRKGNKSCSSYAGKAVWCH